MAVKISICPENEGGSSSKLPPLSPGWLGSRTPKAFIIGLGLIGGSWAGALHLHGWDVFAVEQDSASLNEAINREWIKEGWRELPAKIDADLVICALPISSMLEGLKDLQERVCRGAIVTDVGSIKVPMCQGSSDFLARGVFFIGGHPMTGSEKSGFMAATPDLFGGYPYVISPDPDCPAYAIQKFTGLLCELKAKVVYREAARHDTEVALVSHIPHLLAVSLALAAEDVSRDGLSALQLAGRSFRDLTRIADSSPEMWQEIFTKNSGAILAGLEYWQNRLTELRSYVEAQDGEAIAQAFRKAHQVRKKLMD